MNETPVGRDKRPLESPGTPSPIHKQSKMAGKDSNTSELHSFSSSDNMSVEEKMNKMMEIMLSVKKAKKAYREHLIVR